MFLVAAGQSSADPGGVDDGVENARRFIDVLDLLTEAYVNVVSITLWYI
jgi:hypothetical protein